MLGKAARVLDVLNVLNDKDIRLIKRCSVLPRLGLAALIMSFVSMFLFIPLEMVADLVFHRQSFSSVPLAVVLALVIVNPAKADELLYTCSLTDGFREQLLAGDVYTAIGYTYETVGNVRLQSAFETKGAAEFDKHMRPTVTLGVYPQ